MLNGAIIINSLRFGNAAVLVIIPKEGCHEKVLDFINKKASFGHPDLNALEQDLLNMKDSIREVHQCYATIGI